VRVVALVSDLMDRSRLSAAIPDIAFAADAGSCASADVAVIDLARHGDAVAGVRAAAPGARIVAFGPHVDEEMLTDARAAGADLVLPRSRFFRDPSAALDREI
jgi:hypothetical protein